MGILNNLLGYLIYLLITSFGVDPKIVITILYPVGAITAYFGYLKYSFSFRGHRINPLLRYGIAYLVGYEVNLLRLSMLWEELKFLHQAVQALAMLVVAGVLFLMLQYLVFSKAKSCAK